MTQPRFLSGLASLVDRYDALILDVWGVLHDGVTPFPGVVPTLRHLAHIGRPVILLSNAPMRASVVADRVEAVGIPRHLFWQVMCSGEEVWQCMRARHDPGSDAFYAALGDRCLWLGPGRHAGMCDGVDIIRAETVEDADFILNTGPDGLDDAATNLLPLLRRAAERGLPMICANADLHVVHGGERIVCAGQLAEVYETLGGKVRWHGKPFPSVYDRCFELLGDPDRSRVLAVGDSLTTDIAGAVATGIDSMLITGGIHAEEFAGKEPEEIAALLVGATQPTYVTERLDW